MAEFLDNIPDGLTPEAKAKRREFIEKWESFQKSLEKISLNVLVWGAGPDTNSLAFEKRKDIRKQLLQLGHNAMFSEEFPDSAVVMSQKLIEFAQARASDFVIILLEDSPGALGEAHDFASHPLLIQKTLVLVPKKYEDGYSSKGLLRLLDESHGGVYWYEDQDLTACRVTTKAVTKVEARRQLKYLHDLG